MPKKQAAGAPEVPFPIAGMTFVFTGVFSFGSRAALAKRVKAAGGRVVSTVSRNLDVLVVGGIQKGAEAAAERRARQLNAQGASIKLLPPDDFRRLFMPSREKILAMLKGGSAGLKRWQRLTADPLFWPPVIDLNGIDLRGASLRGLDLQRVALIGADLRDTDLSGGSLHYLKGVNFDNARLVGVWASNLTKCSFRGAVLRGSRFDESRFVKADFTEADLTGCDLSKCDLRGAILKGATLSGAKLMKARLNDADLSGADFRGANLARADLTGAQIDKAEFRGTNIRGAKLGALDPRLAMGLDPARVLPRGKAGPHTRRLAAIARKAKEVSIDIEVDVDGERYTFDIQVWDDGGVRARLSYEQGNYRISGPADGDSIVSCLLNFADTWGDGRLLPETIQVQGKKLPISLEESRSLALAAWCEVFGVPTQ